MRGLVVLHVLVSIQYTHTTSRQIDIQNMQTNMPILQKKCAHEYANFASNYADYASQASASSFDMIAEYVPGSDVTQHSRLDLDQVTSGSQICVLVLVNCPVLEFCFKYFLFKNLLQRDLMSFLAKDPPDFEAAKRIYTEVRFRQKSPTITICT